jgi:Peptidyl-tRNA hydrolase
MFLVAGLGNPGEEYALTPHNLGFLAVDRLAEQHGIRVTRRDSKALVGVGEIDGREVMLAKPQTFMNLSGTFARAADGKARNRIGTARGCL